MEAKNNLVGSSVIVKNSFREKAVVKKKEVATDKLDVTVSLYALMRKTADVKTKLAFIAYAAYELGLRSAEALSNSAYASYVPTDLLEHDKLDHFILVYRTDEDTFAKEIIQGYFGKLPDEKMYLKKIFKALVKRSPKLIRIFEAGLTHLEIKEIHV